MKKIKDLFKTHSAYLLILTLIEIIISIILIISFVYTDSLSYSDSLLYTGSSIEKLFETLYTSTFWALLLLILSFTAIFNIVSIKFKKMEFSFISICLWFLMFILSINLTKPIMDNITNCLLFIPIIIINIIAYNKESQKLLKKKSKN